MYAIVTPWELLKYCLSIGAGAFVIGSSLCIIKACWNIINGK